jgi:Ca2+-transporting ATPase
MVLLLKAMTLCTDAILQSDGSPELQAIGDPTEAALVIAAAEVGIDKDELETQWPRVAEAPFTSERKRMTTIHQPATSSQDSTVPWRQSPYVAFSKGAVDSLLDVSSSLWLGDHDVALNDDYCQRIELANEQLAQQGQRVLGVAFRPVEQLPAEGNEENLEAELTFIGLIGMLDPPRPEVKVAVATATEAGIRSVMITGDHPLTAIYIARELGIADEDDNYMTGAQLAETSIEDLKEVIDEVPVYARVSPEHKLNIVTALQEKGQVVAMTGDGVNDAPALKKADIGVAMGITGTDVSKEAADMVLLDDNYATIVSAVEEGRTIYDNIRKFITYILSSNTGEIIVVLTAPFLGMPLPLLPIQILWVNLVTDGVPGLALTIEPAERGNMQRPPFRPTESVFSRGVGSRILWVGALLGLVSLLVGYAFWLDDPNSPWQTIVFTTLTMSQLGNVLALRSSRESLFQIGVTSNLAMLGALIVTLALQLVIIYVPFFQNIFDTEALTGTQLAITLAASTIVFVAVEIEKLIGRILDRNRLQHA